MSYEVRGNILGFEDMVNVEINEIDELFSTIKDVDDENISFSIVNPYKLREYSFDVTPDVNDILEINEDSKVSVYNIVIIQKPLENSTVNFLAPIVINHDNNKIAQAVLDPQRHPGFGLCETIQSFK